MSQQKMDQLSSVKRKTSQKIDSLIEESRKILPKKDYKVVRSSKAEESRDILVQMANKHNVLKLVTTSPLIGDVTTSEHAVSRSRAILNSVMESKPVSHFLPPVQAPNVTIDASILQSNDDVVSVESYF
ncbi:hypothetical protein PCE1_002285 [Barthelona sp. PCE]